MNSIILKVAAIWSIIMPSIGFSTSVLPLPKTIVTEDILWYEVTNDLLIVCWGDGVFACVDIKTAEIKSKFQVKISIHAKKIYLLHLTRIHYWQLSTQAAKYPVDVFGTTREPSHLMSSDERTGLPPLKLLRPCGPISNPISQAPHRMASLHNKTADQI